MQQLTNLRNYKIHYLFSYLDIPFIGTVFILGRVVLVFFCYHDISMNFLLLLTMINTYELRVEPLIIYLKGLRSLSLGPIHC
jgi:hypothetical protein